MKYSMVWPKEIRKYIEKQRLIAVLVIDEYVDAPVVANTLIEGGVDVIELTLRTPDAFRALEEIRKKVPDMIAGVGTVLTPDQCRTAQSAGAEFAVSPGFNKKVVETAIAINLPFSPGIATPSDIEGAYEIGCDILKIFPAEHLGGLTYLKSINAPYAHLSISYIPLGGINEGNLSNWLSQPEVLAIGGSWIAPREIIIEKNWKEIKNRACKARLIADSVERETL